MIETPLDILDSRRQTFLKAYYDGIGLSEAASEYLDAYSTVTKMDIYHEGVYNENILLMIAKQEEVDASSFPEYGRDFFADDPRYGTYTMEGVNQEAMSEGFGGLTMEFPTMYRRDTNATNFDFAPRPDANINEVHHLMPENNPIQSMVRHTFSDGTQKDIPAWYAALLNYYAVSEDDKYHAGMSRAEYDHGRIKGWLKDGREKRNIRSVANRSDFFDSMGRVSPDFDMDGTGFKRLSDFPQYGTPLQKIERMLPEIENGDFTLTDYLHGFEGISLADRDAIYEELMNNGYDNAVDFTGLGDFSKDNIRFNLGLRLKPLMDFLVRPTSHASDNHFAGHEPVAKEHEEIPHHVYDSMTKGDIYQLHRNMYQILGLDERNKAQIENVAKNIFEMEPDISETEALALAREQDLLSYDMFKFDGQNFSMNRLNEPAENFDHWWHKKANRGNLTRRGFYASIGWDNERGKFYELGESPHSQFVAYTQPRQHFQNRIQEIEKNMKTGRDAIYEGTHLRNQAIPWLSRRVKVDDFGDFMNGDHRGFNDIFAEKFQHKGGHHLDPNNALRVLAPIFHRNGENLLFDVEHPEDYSRRSLLFENPDEDLYYIGPKEEYELDALGSDAEPKLLSSTSNALSWAGQPQLTRFFHHIYENDAFTNYARDKEAGLDPEKPKPIKRIMRSLGSIPHINAPEGGENKAKYDRKKAYRNKLLKIQEKISPSAHLGQYLTPYFGAAKGSGGLTKTPRGSTHSVPSTRHSSEGHIANMQTSDPSKDQTHFRRLSGQSKVGDDGYEAIQNNFRRMGPDAKRTEISGVDQQTRADFKKVGEANRRHEATGAGNEPNMPQEQNVLGINERVPFNEVVSQLLDHLNTRDDIERKTKLQTAFDDATKELDKRRAQIEYHKNDIQKLRKEISELGSGEYKKRAGLLNRLKQVEDYLQQKEKGWTDAEGKINPSPKELASLKQTAKTKLNNYLSGPMRHKRQLLDLANEYLILHDLEATDQPTIDRINELKEQITEENQKLLGLPSNIIFNDSHRKHVNMKYDSDMNAIGMKVNEMRRLLDSQGISIGDDPFEMLSNLMVLAHEAERSLHSHESTGDNDPYRTYNESVDDEKTELHDGGKTHSSIRALLEANGHHIGHMDTGYQMFNNDRSGVSEDIVQLMNQINRANSHLPDNKRTEMALRTRQMSVRELLSAMHPELDKGFTPAEGSEQIRNLQSLLHLDDSYKPTKKTKEIANKLGLHFIPPKGDEFGGYNRLLSGHLLVDPSADTTGITHITTASMKNRMQPISNVSKEGGLGINCFFTDPNNHFKYSGYRPTIKPIIDSNHKFVGWEKVEPYEYDSRTPPRSIYEQGVPELMQYLGQIDTSRLIRPAAYSGLFSRADEQDAAMLLASLSNPDIMLKKDGEYPILQPMHRIFKLEDLEHLRGFSGDWIVSAMPEGPRAFVEKKDDKITVRGDFDLDDDTKKNFSKISKKNFVVDVVLAGKEYNVIDIVEYDDSDVHDMPLQERIKILRGTMESTENVLLPAAHNLRLTDDIGLEVIVKDLLKEHKRLVLRDANSTYMKGENRHPKWVLYDEGQDVNLMVLDRKGTSSYTYRLGTGPITHEDSLGERAAEYEGDTYMDVGTSFQSKDKYEVGDIVTVNVDSVSVTENVDGADIYTVSSNEIKGEAEGEGVSSVETLSMFTKSEPMMWPHDIDRDGDRIVIKMAAGDVSYRASEIDGEWYMFNPKADNGWLIRLSESQRPFWSSVVGVMLKADLSLYDDESKAEVHESKNDAKPLIPPKKVKNTNFWESEVDEAIEHKKKVKRLLAKSLALASNMLKSSVGAVGDASSGAKGLGIDFATPIESPSGPTSLVGSKTLPDHDARDIERDNKERAEDKKMGYGEPIPDDEQGELAVNRDKAAFVSY